MRGLILVANILLSLAVALDVAGQSSPPPYRVVVNPNNAVDAVDRQFLAEAFLKKTTRWSSGEAIAPADLAPDSRARREFSNDVLHRSVAEVKRYWQQKTFAGRDVPPPEFDSDAEVVQFVLKHPGAVGYVSGAANVGDARTVSVR